MKKKKTTTKDLPVLFLVAPCYNEENVLPITYKLFTEKLDSLVKKKIISAKSKTLFVNDGSSDSTWSIIQDLAKKNKYIEGVCLSRNRGHQNALLAGLMEAKDRCDVTITLDCDGQHDIEAVDLFLEEYNKGYEVVYGIRNNRVGDNFLKKAFSEIYYILLKALGGEVITNHADYRLVSSRVLNEFKNFEEVNIFLRGLFPLVGFKSTTINYDQFDRAAGKSHYSLSKMLTLAIDGITSLSIKPIRIITVFGALASLIALINLIISIVRHDSLWTATHLICLMLGIVLSSLGVIGEYIGKTYMESKHRPRYIVSERTYKEK